MHNNSSDDPGRHRDDANRLTPAVSNAGAFGQLVASFAGTALVLAVNFGLPITAEQQAAVLSFLIQGWALASAAYLLIRRARGS